MCWFSVKWRVGARPLDAIFGGKSAQPHAVARRGGGPADCNGFQEEIKLGYQLATKRIHNSSGIFNTACGPGRQAAQRVHQTVASRLRHFSTSGLRHPGAIGRSTYTRLEDLSHVSWFGSCAAIEDEDGHRVAPDFADGACGRRVGISGVLDASGFVVPVEGDQVRRIVRLRNGARALASGISGLALFDDASGQATGKDLGSEEVGRGAVLDAE